MTEGTPSTAMRRHPDDGLIAGVCVAFARRLGIDPLLIRIGFVASLALVVGGALIFLYANNALAPAKDVLLPVVVILASAAIILAPWWLRLVRGLATERAERIRSQERAEVAAHLHDSVLQTLALVQRRADDPREVAALARRQARELRGWLLRGVAPAASASSSLGAALEELAASTEAEQGVP